MNAAGCSAKIPPKGPYEDCSPVTMGMTSTVESSGSVVKPVKLLFLGWLRGTLFL